MASLFGGGKKPVPTLSAAEIEAERKRILAEQKSGGKAGTVLSGGAGLTAPLLGNSPTLMGGTV